MATDVAVLKADIDKLDDESLDALRRDVDNTLLVAPEEALANQGVQAVLIEYLAKNDVFVKMSITARSGGIVTTIVEKSNIPAAGFILASVWLFIWINKRKG